MSASAILLICLLFVTEIIFRTYDKALRGIPFTTSIMNFYDQELGWKGKKVFGDTATKKYKIFVVGDSITDGLNVAEKDMYYSIIGKELDAEIFVYAGGGYGTLQEYMVIDRYFDKIKPDLVILQTCNNDFINNLWDLESASFFNNNLMIRPYLINEKIEYRFPKRHGKLRIFLSSNSRISYYLTRRIDMLFAGLAKKGLVKSVEKHIRERGTSFDKFKKAVEVTDNLMAKIKSRVGKTPIVAFTFGEKERFKMIFQKNDIEFFGDMNEEVQKEEIKSGKMRLKDNSHWDTKGQQLCGQILAGELRKRGYPKK